MGVHDASRPAGRESPGEPSLIRLVDHPSREIVYYVDAGAGRPSLRPLQLSFAVIADHGIEQLEEILDSHRVIERMAEAGSEPVAILVSLELGFNLR